MKYRYLSEQKGRYSVRLMCRALGVTPQGYSQWSKRAVRREHREREDRRLRDRIRIAHAESRRTYGRKRVTKELRERGLSIGEKRVGRLMKLEKLQAKAARKFKVTTDSRHHHPIAPNILARDFNADAPNQKWAGDITYLWTGEGWLYLAVVMDLYSRRIVGWALKERLGSALVCAALQMAVKHRGRFGTLCHFDRGTEYASDVFQALLRRCGFRCSMSRKGNCWDNAVVESFFHSLKVEAVHGETFRTRDEARRAVLGWLEGFYNTTRRHSSLGYLSPREFEQRTQRAA